MHLQVSDKDKNIHRRGEETDVDETTPQTRTYVLTQIQIELEIFLLCKFDYVRRNTEEADETTLQNFYPENQQGLSSVSCWNLAVSSRCPGSSDDHQTRVI